MQKVMLAVILVLSTTTVSAQPSLTINETEAHLAWHYADNSEENLYRLIDIMTTLKIIGYHDMEFFFWGYDAFRASGVRMGSPNRVWDYHSYLLNLVRNPTHYYPLVFGDGDDRSQVMELARHARQASGIKDDLLVMAMIAKNQNEAKKILNIP